MRHIIAIHVSNNFGAFDRVATMFSAKGFNIHSLSVGETEIKDISRMTIVTSGNDQIIDQIEKQLHRLIDTIKVTNLTHNDHLERELALISVNYQKGQLDEIKNVSDIFRGFVVDINNKSVTLEITGPPAKINAAINVLSPFGIKEIARSGTVAIKRGTQIEMQKKDVA